MPSIYKVTYGRRGKTKRFYTYLDAWTFSSSVENTQITECPQIFMCEAFKARKAKWQERIIILSRNTICWCIINRKTGELTTGYGKGEMRLTSENVYNAGVNADGNFFIGTDDDHIIISPLKGITAKDLVNVLKETNHRTTAELREIIENTHHDADQATKQSIPVKIITENTCREANVAAKDKVVCDGLKTSPVTPPSSPLYNCV